MIDLPKPPAETESRRNLGSTVFGMAHEVGYARVSKREQNPDAQAAELRAAGCERVFVDHGESSRVADRPQWLACLDYLRPGDTLKVRRLDRLAGSERILIETLQDLDARQVNIVSLTEPMVDTTTPEQIATAERMRAEQQSWASIARVLGVGATSVRRALDR